MRSAKEKGTSAKEGDILEMGGSRASMTYLKCSQWHASCLDFTTVVLKREEKAT